MTNLVQFDDGALHIDKKPQLLLAGDYPYYRDHPDHWLDRLRKIKAAGIRIVTFYIPWRHHAIGDHIDTFCFDGRSGGRANTDVLGFIAGLRQVGLYGIAKPGPFVHGEIQFGGLPDGVSPSRDLRFEAIRDADGTPLMSQDLELPSPLGAAFVAAAQTWMAAVWQTVIEPNLHSRGPVIALQIGNEGVYSDASLPLTAFDYSEAGLAVYRRFLARRYGTIEQYNGAHGSGYGSFAEVQPPRTGADAPHLARREWADWIGSYYAEVFREIAAPVTASAARLINIPPPAASRTYPKDPATRYNSWLCRVRPETWPGIHYGYTSWVGNILDDDEAFMAYVFAAKRRRGPNLEENWGFLWDDDRYVAAITGIHHAAIALGAGATGINIYTACATADWDQVIDLDPEFRHRTLPRPELFDPPYCPAAPIDSGGESDREIRRSASVSRLSRSRERYAGTMPAERRGGGRLQPRSCRRHGLARFDRGWFGSCQRPDPDIAGTLHRRWSRLRGREPGRNRGWCADQAPLPHDRRRHADGAVAPAGACGPCRPR